MVSFIAMRRFLTLLFCLIKLNFLFALDPGDSTKIKSIMAEGQELLDNSKHSASIDKFLEAREMSKASNLDVFQIKSEIKLIINFWRLNLLDSAESMANRSIRNAKNWFGNEAFEVGELYHQLGVIKMYQGSFDSALMYYENATTINSKYGEKGWPTLSAAHVNRSYILCNNGRMIEGIEEARKAYEYDIKIYGDNHMYVAEDLSNISAFYMYINRYSEAIPYLKKSIGIFEEIGNTGEGYAFALSNLGHAYSRMREFDKAHDYEYRSMNLLKEFYGEKHISMASMYEKIGKSFLDEGKYDSSIYYCKKGLEFDEELEARSDHILIFLYRSIMLSYAKKDDFESSEKYIAKALKYVQSSFPESHFPGIIYNDAGLINHWKADYTKAEEYYQKALEFLAKVNDSSMLTYTLEDLAELYQNSKKYGLALEYAQKSLISNHYSWKPSSNFENPPLSGHLNVENFMIALKTKAEALLEMYKIDKDSSSLNASIRTFNLLDKILKKEIKRIDRFDDKIKFSEFSSNAYENAIEANIWAYKTFNNQEFIKRSFQLNEAKKHITLKDILNRQNALSWSGIPDSLLELELKLKSDLSYTTSEWYKNQSDGSFTSTSIQPELVTLRSKIDSLEGYFEEHFPNYYNSRNEDYNLDIERLQRNMTAEQAILDYSIGDSLSYLFILRKDSLFLKELGPSKEIKTKVNMLLQYCYSFDSNYKHRDQFYQANFEVFKKVIQPVLPHLKSASEFLIIPSGVLHYMPFDMLVSEEVDSAKDPKYLLETYSIRTSNSLLQENLLQPKSIITKSGVVGFAPSYGDSYENGLSLSKLKWNSEEVITIKEHFKGQMFINKLATERNFKEIETQYSILHLSMHTKVDKTNFKNSFFAFTNSKDSLEDDLLYPHEISSATFGTSLAVLSGCQTGYGEYLNGEGIMSLAQAFAYAGVPSVIISHWEVDDKATSILMNAFYKHLADGTPANESLRKAKLDYLLDPNPNKVHPFYWASMTLIGSDMSIKIQSYPIPIVIGYSSILLIFLGSVLRNSVKNRFLQ